MGWLYLKVNPSGLCYLAFRFFGCDIYALYHFLVEWIVRCALNPDELYFNLHWKAAIRVLDIKLVAALLLCFLVPSCSVSSEERALKELAKMHTADFFDDPAQRLLDEALERGNLDRARTALKQGADINAVGRDGMTPLFWALAKQNITGFRFLLEQGSDPNVVVELPPNLQEEQAGAMEMTAQLEDPAYLRALLEHGGDPNITVNQQWDIPLIYRAIMSRVWIM